MQLKALQQKNKYYLLHIVLQVQSLQQELYKEYNIRNNSLEELLEKYESIKPLLTKIVVKPAFIEYFKDLNTSFDFQAVTYNIQNQTVFGRSITKLESLDTKKEKFNTFLLTNFISIQND